MCIYVYMYICIYIYICVCVHVCISIYLMYNCSHIYICIYCSIVEQEFVYWVGSGQGSKNLQSFNEKPLEKHRFCTRTVSGRFRDGLGGARGEGSKSSNSSQSSKSRKNSKNCSIRASSWPRSSSSSSPPTPTATCQQIYPKP